VSFLPAHAEEAAEASEYTGNVRGFIGQKSLDDDDWSPVDKHGSMGVFFDIKKHSWPVSIAIDLIGSGDIHENGALKTEGFTGEHRFGIRKTFDVESSSIHPYIGGGVTFICAVEKHKNAGVQTSKDDDDAAGAWVGAGMYYTVTEHFNVGVDVSYSEAEVTLFGVDREAGGVNTGITAGYHW
jgi:opacity protein-like surface antigen